MNLQWTELSSDNIHSIAQVGTTLLVRFHSGFQYEYYNVPDGTDREFEKYESPTAFLKIVEQDLCSRYENVGTW